MAEWAITDGMDGDKSFRNFWERDLERPNVE